MAAALSSGGVSCLQVYQLQQEKKKLQEDFVQVLKEREQLEERCTSYEHEKIQLGPRLEESKWEVSTEAVYWQVLPDTIRIMILGSR